MTSIIVAFFVSLLVATVLTPIVLRLATRRGLFDQPSDRKVHSRLVPRLGGVAIVIGFFTPVTGLLLVEAGLTQQLTQSAPQLIGLFVGGLLIALLGLYDDLRGANARQKFAVQIGVALLMWALHYRIWAISIPFGGYIDLGVFSLPVTIIWFVAVMNAVNLIDGLDGLAGGIGLISVSTLLVLALMEQNVLGAFMSACLAGSLVGFLFFNFNPARIFMGDTGSLFIGFVLAAFSISTLSKGSTAIALAVPILAPPRELDDPFGAAGLEARAALDALATRLGSATSSAAIASEMNELAQRTRCLSVVLLDGERTLFVFDRPPTTHEAMCPLGSYEIPLAARAAPGAAGARLELRFARADEATGDLGVVLPWERVRTALADALERQGWPVLQEPLPALPTSDQPLEPVPAIDPVSAWSPSKARPKGA